MLTLLESAMESCDTTANLENKTSALLGWGGGAHEDGTAEKPTLAMVPMRVITRGNPHG